MVELVRRQQRQSTGSARFCVNGSLQSGCPEWPWWWGDGVERRIAGRIERLGAQNGEVVRIMIVNIWWFWSRRGRDEESMGVY
ncbi:hypothetical protein M0R45_016933 [Rubus argutus]|uniref:Uncharacterized protein n=1 Tax=Rubus argutus TaxID=59490 RepID=A0AAW1XU16_RUBAR